MGVSSRGRRLLLLSALGVCAGIGPGWAADPPTYADAPVALPDRSAAAPAGQPKVTEKPAASPNRMLFEANWKNVNIGHEEAVFQQGDHAYIWTVTNTGTTPVDVAGYGFSIAPGEEEFVVDTRLVLQTGADGGTTVDVKASRVMKRSELSQPTQPVPMYTNPNARPLGSAPSAGSFGPERRTPARSTPADFNFPAAPADQFAPAKKPSTNPL